MSASQLNLTGNQVDSFDQFLIDGTSSTLDAFENMFGLNIDSSSSSIEIAPQASNDTLKNLGSGPLYVVSSSLAGDMQGRLLLFMRSVDFDYLSEAMRPVLSLLFLCSPEADLEQLNRRMLECIHDADEHDSGEVLFHKQMMDALAEMGNVLIGLYSKAMYNICNLNTHHSLPFAVRDPDHRLIGRALSLLETMDQPFILIENEFVVMDRPIKLWCLISPSQESCKDLLKRIE